MMFYNWLKYKGKLFALVITAVAASLVFAVSFSTAMACSGCEVHYPWMHRLPTAGELEAATLDFVEDYHAAALENKQDVAIAHIWYLTIANPGITEQHDTFDVIACLKADMGNATHKTTAYHYTTLSYCVNDGFYFWPHLHGSFMQREDMERYLEEYIIRRPLDDHHVELVKYEGQLLTNQQSLKTLLSVDRNFALSAVFITMNVALVTYTVKASLRRAKLQKRE